MLTCSGTPIDIRFQTHTCVPLFFVTVQMVRPIPFGIPLPTKLPLKTLRDFIKHSFKFPDPGPWGFPDITPYWERPRDGVVWPWRIWWGGGVRTPDMTSYFGREVGGWWSIGGERRGREKRSRGGKEARKDTSYITLSSIHDKKLKAARIEAKKYFR